MSKFRSPSRDAARDVVLPAQPAGNLVPVTAEEFARQRRQKFIKWGSAGVLAALVILSFLYRSSVPSAALNNYQDAKKLFDNGKYADALITVEPATKDRSRRVEAYQLRTAIYRALNRNSDALADIARVIQLQPGDAANYRLRAEICLDSNDPARALPDYTKVVEIEKSPLAYTDRGLCYLKLNQPRQAIDDFNKAIELHPSMESYLQRGLAYAAQGDHRKAIDDFTRAIELRPANSAPYRARANSEQLLGDLAAAQGDRDQAFTMERPVPPVVQTGLGK